MKKYKWFLLQVLVLTIIFLPTIAMAVSLNVSYDQDGLDIGDTIEVNVTVSGDNLSVAEGEFTYDYNVLSYVESYGGASDGKFNMISASDGGTSSLTAVIKFEAIASGESIVDIKFDNILNYEGTKLSSLDEFVTIEVLSESIGEDSSDEADYQADFDGVEAGVVFNSESKMFISKSVENLTLPSGFIDFTASYNGQEIGAAISAHDDKTVLFYLYNNLGEGGYYVFDEESSSLSPYVKIASEPDDCIVLWNNGVLDIPSSYSQTSIEVNGKNVSGYVSDEIDNPSYIVYAVSEAGQKGYYQYSATDNSILQFLGDMKEEVKPVIADSEENNKSFADNRMFLAVSIICFILFIALMVFIVKYARAVKDKEELLAVSRRKIQEYKKLLNR